MIRPLVAESLGSALLAIAGLGAAQSAVAAGLPPIPVVAVAVGLMLAITITLLMPVSGGHLNPVVTLLFLARRQIRPGAALAYVGAQAAGGLAGAAVVAAMAGTGTPVAHLPEGWLLAEALAAGGFVFIVAGALAARPDVAAVISGAFATAIILATPSGGLSNPALMLARALTDATGGLAPSVALPLALAQIAGALAALVPSLWLFGPPRG